MGPLLAGAAASFLSGAGGGSAITGIAGSLLGGGGGLDLLDSFVKTALEGDGPQGAQSRTTEPLGVPSPLELLQQLPSPLEQTLGKPSQLDAFLASGQGGPQGGGPFG